jgi:hypothetical protein
MNEDQFEREKLYQGKHEYVSGDAKGRPDHRGAIRHN